ncbi:MFS transporter [Pyxidicoccus fallax]|uniref:MFS transporter n=1 Tax=Pyxidicoccus fallax TaxID=394095 RepID=A0A848L7R6_9BACT|nr:MFS transporter [Pyxidicoccus fallax]NMO14606.1 MFS transporter [Pyxidicoccus fallax]NPC77370.1 MFS transporter [Pyxidicoccus fallax]
MGSVVDGQTVNAGRVLLLLFLANLLNFFDRTIPAVVIEPLRKEYALSDLQLGLVSAAFTLIYAVAGIPLGKLADTGSRRKVLGWGLLVWSGFTGLNALAWNYWSFFLLRLGVGVGEASYAPAASSLISDLYPANRRARATGIYMLGLPVGLMLAFFTVGGMVTAFGSWRAPFLIAAVPGMVLALFMFFIREPERGASEEARISQQPVAQPIRTLLRIRTLTWLTLSGVTLNFATYAGNGFLVPLLQRYFELPLVQAAVVTGFITGVTGLVGLTLGGWVADRAHARSERGRLTFGTLSLLVGAVGTGLALLSGKASVPLFAVCFGLGWLGLYNYYTSVYPAIQDVVEPRLRAQAMALFFAGMYVLGGALGPAVVGGLSDVFTVSAMREAGAVEVTEAFKATGLHSAMFLIPVMLLLTAVFMHLASRSFVADARRMRESLARVEVDGARGLREVA